MIRKALVLFNNIPCGQLSELDDHFEFAYLDEYLLRDDKQAVSLSLPLTKDVFTSPILFPFFDGLIPEGWLLDVLISRNNANPLDRFELLMLSGEDCIGAVSVRRSE